ncbi:MAG: hypothetical protein AABZ31_12400, partial [Bdellovibrionota bacterium]
QDTVILSAVSAPIAGILGMFIAYLVIRKKFLGRKLLDVTAMVPFALPGTAVGIGYILAFIFGLEHLGIWIALLVALMFSAGLLTWRFQRLTKRAQ